MEKVCSYIEEYTQGKLSADNLLKALETKVSPTVLAEVVDTIIASPYWIFTDEQRYRVKKVLHRLKEESKKKVPSLATPQLTHIAAWVICKHVAHPEIGKAVYKFLRNKVENLSAKATATKVHDSIYIQLKYNPEFNEKLKRLVDPLRWDRKRKVWVTSCGVPQALMLEYLGVELDEALRELIDAEAEERQKARQRFTIPNLKGELRPFQREGVWYIESRGGRVLIADEMGLGKTVQALGWLQLHPELRPAVVVCPASVKYHWASEIVRWLDNPTVYVVENYVQESEAAALKTDPYSILQDYLYHEGNPENIIVVVNYDILVNRVLNRKDSDDVKVFTGRAIHLALLEPKVLVLDECHYIKNPSAKRTKAVEYLAKDVKHIIALSGTPITSKPIEFYPILRLLRPSLFRSKHQFGVVYCAGKRNFWGWEYNGASNVAELNRLLTAYLMIRRKKEEVLTELPPKVRTIIPVSIENMDEYKLAEENFIEWLRQQDPEAVLRLSHTVMLVKIEKLKQIAVKGKMKSLLSWISDYLESTEGKLIVFAAHRSTVDEILKKFPLYTKDKKKGVSVVITGDVSHKERKEAVELFQTNDKVRLFVGMIQAAAEGITLTAANTVLFAELPWTPAEVRQAEDRAHRITQKDTVNVYFMVGRKTIEEKIMSLLDKKLSIVTKVLDGRDVEKEDLLTELLKTHFLGSVQRHRAVKRDG